MDEVGPNLLVELIILFFLIAINAFFSASEIAIVSCDKNKLENMSEDGNERATSVLEQFEKHTKFLSTIQVILTYIGFFSASLCASGLSVSLSKKLVFLGLTRQTTYWISVLFVLLILSFVYILFGQLIPKRIALSVADSFALFSINIVKFCYFLLKPFVYLLSKSTKLILSIVGIKTLNVESKITVEEIKSMVEVGKEQGLINSKEKDMIDAVITFNEKTAEEIMTARTEVFAIDLEDDIDDYLDKLMELKFSRIPIYEGDVDNILGIIYIKDYMSEAYKNGFGHVDLRKILKPPYFVSETKNINDLFYDMKKKRIHLAILIDEYGGFSGIVTMEDLVEEIVGNIEDEYDHEAPDIIQVDKFNFIVKGSTSIKEINSNIGLEIDELSDDYDTLGGMLINFLGYIPDDGFKRKIDIDGVLYNIIFVEDKRIKKVKITLPKNFYE
ncbi:hemolysin family protein [uncultured Finegoldia sp.]|uniref:hemolysin family protein n=1 Tax=uncultured Finegoldia sp. TaxID=328009 RepID=UPI00260D0E5B|nr:hemolysin family protein [uncultured Finegoldia sp.]